MANEDAVFKFGADTRPVDSALDSLTGKITDFGKTAGVALAGIFAAQKLVGFFNDATAAALESEKAIKQFNFALKTAGVYSEETSKGFQKYAESLQALTGVQDEAILEGATNLIQIGELSGETLNRTIVAALDFAAAKGIDAATAFDMLARAAQGNVMPFAKLGVEFSKNATDAEKLNNVLGFIETKFSGAAQNNLTGYQGALTNLSNAWSDLLENVGKTTTESDFAISSINAIATAVKGLENLILFTIEGTRNWVAAFGAVGQAIAGVIDAIGLMEPSRITRSVDLASESFARAQVKNAEWRTELQATSLLLDELPNKFNNYNNGLEDIISSKQKMIDELRKLHQEWLDSLPKFSNFVSGFKKGLSEMSGSVMQLGKMVSGTFVSGFSNAFASVGKAIVKGEDAFSAFGSAILQMLGAIAIQMGQFYIAAGIAAMFLNPGSGIGMIVAGGALSVLGGVLQALGGGSGGAPSAASSGVGASQPLGETDTSSFMNEMTQDQERISPNSGVQVVIQGNVLDRRETGLAIAEIINETFNTNGVTITANA